jgi:hypothetical protein
MPLTVGELIKQLIELVDCPHCGAGVNTDTPVHLSLGVLRDDVQGEFDLSVECNSSGADFSDEAASLYIDDPPFDDDDETNDCRVVIRGGVEEESPTAT